MAAAAPDRVIRLARPSYRISIAGLVAVPLLLVFAGAVGGRSEDRIRAQFDHVALPETYCAMGWSAIRGVAGVALSLALLAVWQARCLFAFYRTGEVLGHLAATRIRRVGQSVLALAIFGLFGETLIILALTSANRPGARSPSVILGSDGLFAGLMAGLLIVIGWAMSEAARVAEDTAGFV